MRLFLNGGGSDTQIVSALKRMNRVIVHDKPLLYIPLAMDEREHSYDDCYDWICSQLVNISIPRVDMVRTFEELVLKDLNDYCAIFIGGGNTYKLLKGLKDSNSFKKIYDYVMNDGIVFGGSAGSVIFGKDIDIISSMDLNDVDLKDTTGFNILNDVSIFPHYMNKKSKLTDYENEELYSRYTKSIVDFSKLIGPVIAYPEEDTLFIDGNNIEMIGNRDYYYIDNGNIYKNILFNNDKN